MGQGYVPSGGGSDFHLPYTPGKTYNVGDIFTYNDGGTQKVYIVQTSFTATNFVADSGNFNEIGGAGGTTEKLSTVSIDLTALATTVDGDKAATYTLATTPVDGSYIIVDVNGKNEVVGDASTSKVFYFSGDGGTTPRSFSSAHANGQVQSGDELFFNGSVAGYQLDVTDKLSIYQLIN